MVKRCKNLSLYLALVCFVGLILIFIFDGYMGVYDSLVMDNGQYQQTVEADQWAQSDRYAYRASTNVDRSGKVDFAYKIDNHRFSEYEVEVYVSLWHNQDKLSDLIAGTLAAAPFSSGELKWSIDAAELVPADFPAEQSYNVNIHIQRAGIEREVVININPSPYPPKPVIIERTG